MDNAGVGAGDDQGSGWFQVKKKHRSSSKFSIRNWVEGSSRQQANGKSRNSNSKIQINVSKPGKDSVQRNVAGHSSTSKEDGKDECCLDKRVVGGDNDCVKILPLKTTTPASSESTSVGNESFSDKKLHILHRIKWGDLEDDVLAPVDGSSAASDIRFGEIGDDDLAMCGTSRNLFDLSTCNLSKDCPVVSKEIAEVLNAGSDACNMLNYLEDSHDGNCEEVNEVDSTNVEKLSTSSNLVGGKTDNLDCSKVENNYADPLKKVLPCSRELSVDKVPFSSAEGVAKTVEVSAPILIPDEIDSGISALNTDDGDTEVIIVEDPMVVALSDRSLPEAPANSNSAVADNRCSDTSRYSSSDAPFVNTVVERGGESKERFRERLWSFLFENLNRAVDELYLLCELECDLEQVKEAILVLQEAESDFRELNIRVVEFDKMKKNACQSTSGAVMSTKGDHRRPHALSWEVRRMTTSPHRAEILSSSLEAFKKIQEERARERAAGEVSVMDSQVLTCSPATVDIRNRSIMSDASELESKLRRKSSISNVTSVNRSREKRDTDSGRSSKTLVQNSRLSPSSSSDPNTGKLPHRSHYAAPTGGKGRAERLGSSAEVERNYDSGEFLKRRSAASEKERERRNSQSWNPADAWKEKRNWEEILAAPCRLSSRLSYPPCMSRKSAERARILHDKLLSPEKKKKTAVDLKKEAEEKHARAMRIRSELESERIQKLQRTSEKLNRVNERQAVRSMKLKEGMYARHQRSESRHEAYLANVVKKAGDESNKVNEVRFITSLNEETKKFLLRQKLHDSELRRAEKFQVFKTKQKEDMAREEAVMERRKLIESEKLQRLAETQKRKEEAQLRREEERKASSAAREARTMEQLRRKEERAKAQQEESELLAQRLAERLRESEQRRKVYLEQIRERASMDFRDQSSPLMRRVVNKEGQGRTTPPKTRDDNQENNPLGGMDSSAANSSTGTHQSLKRRIKKIRQRLMALKHELPETPATENIGIGYRTGMATARAKIGRWLQELQRLRQERKEGAASIGLIAAEMIKFLEGKELELQASRRAGLLDFISSALPASHISKPEACQVTIYLLKLLKVVLFVPANRSYFLAQNLLPPLIPMLSAALESYIKIAASLNISGSSNSQLTKTSSESFDSISEVLDGFLCAVTMIIGHPTFNERQRQMQDGLLELVISYQIIHRLRDLFALYDRPQVEGSPFPSSILLSINLFVVLTSRPCAVSSIDWEGFQMSENKGQQSDLLKNPGCPLEYYSQDGLQLQSSAVNVHSSEISGAQQDDHRGELYQTNLLIHSKLSGEAVEVETGLERSDSLKDSETNSTNVNISLKQEKNCSYIGIGGRDEQHMGLKQPHAFILSAISETGLISLPSLLTAVLLQANSKSSEQGSYVLPSNFEEVATGVLKVLNNLALMDITFMQQMLARPDLKMEFFHIMSFLLTHCTNSWKVASDQVGLLLLESLLLLGYFSLFHPGNQAVLRWGSSPTILHKVCDLPFAFFSDPELMPILGGTLVAACFGCEQNKGVVQQELSIEMILSVVRASRSSLPRARSSSPTGNPLVEDSTESSTLEPRKQQSDVSVKPIRSTGRNSRLSMAKGGPPGTSSHRISKLRHPKDGKASKTSEEAMSKLKPDAAASEAPVTLPLYARFPASFVGRAEQFFSSEPNSCLYNAHI